MGFGKLKKEEKKIITLSNRKIMVWVQDDEETDFLMSEKAIISPQGSPSIYMINNINHLVSYALWGREIDRNVKHLCKENIKLRKKIMELEDK